MSKIILLDTNFSALPIYNYLINNHDEVFVVGANPSDYLAKTVKNYINLDYSNIDRIRYLIESLNIDYIVPGGNDRSYYICALLNSEGKFKGLDSIEKTEIINNKEKFRNFALKNRIPVPRMFTQNQVGDIWPLIVKPVDSYSGKGITILRKNEQFSLNSAINNAKAVSRTNTCIIEEFIEGQLYSHSAFISNGSVLIDFIVEERSTVNPFVVDTSRVVYDFSDYLLSQLRTEICKMTNILNLTDGLIHTQFIKKDNLFWFIEITRRCPGDLYSMLIELSTGFPYAETYAKPFLNQKLVSPIEKLKKLNIIRHTISQSYDDYFGALQFNVPLNIEKIVPLCSTGDMIKASPNGRIGLLFLLTKSEKELNDVFDLTLQRKLYTVQ